MPARGVPRMWCDGPFAIGHYDDDRAWSSLTVDDHTVLAVDGRVDALLPEGPAELRDERGHALLGAVVSRLGARGLEYVAADYALARVDRRRGVLVLAREAFGQRPLFWARRGGTFAFATDVAVLVALGAATGELDPFRVRAYLAECDGDDEGTAFVGVSRVAGGTWLEADVAGRLGVGRWFRPEAIPVDERPLPEAAEAMRAAIVEATADRVRGRRAAILLSGGRDSSSVAVAAAQAGAKLTCLTNAYPAEFGCSEVEEARQVADALGFECRPIPMPMAATPHDLEQLPSAVGTPIAFPSFTELLAIRQGVADAGPDVLLDGAGGDFLFAAHPVAVLDFVRAGRLRDAAAAARAFDRDRRYGYRGVAKSIARALLPAGVLARHDRRRPSAPWLLGACSHPGPKVRSDRAHLTDGLRWLGLEPFAELPDRLFLATGARWTSPLYDQRVVRLALAQPVDHRVPRPGPKPLLSRGLLGELDATRRKTSFLPYYLAFGQRTARALRDWLGPGTEAVKQGFVAPYIFDDDIPAWLVAPMLRRIVLEAWLRRN